MDQSGVLRQRIKCEPKSRPRVKSGFRTDWSTNPILIQTRIKGYHIEKNIRKCMIISKFLHNNCMAKSINYVNLVEKTMCVSILNNSLVFSICDFFN